jgi:hypothetical protein
MLPCGNAGTSSSGSRGRGDGGLGARAAHHKGGQPSYSSLAIAVPPRFCIAFTHPLVVPIVGEACKASHIGTPAPLRGRG